MKGNINYWQKRGELKFQFDLKKILKLSCSVFSTLVYSQSRGQAGTQESQDLHRSAGALCLWSPRLQLPNTINAALWLQATHFYVHNSWKLSEQIIRLPLKSPMSFCPIRLSSACGIEALQYVSSLWDDLVVLSVCLSCLISAATSPRWTAVARPSPQHLIPS